MIHFECDYTTGAHPKVMQALVDTNLEACSGYGVDDHCKQAAGLIRDLCQAPEADVHFLVGGTQTNMTVIAALLRPHQGVLCAQSGHINVHETGAVEATGHKVLGLPAVNGKITAQQIDDACRAHYEDPSTEHLVQPGMVYLSQTTELGTVYSKAELEAIRTVADRWGIPVFIDGARLACALAVSDVTLPDLARLCDVFYIGGTKAGLLFGEAVVITRDAWKRDFRYLIKQRGGMLAKGRLLGVQFAALLSDGLYEQIGRHEVALALRLKQAFLDKGFPMLMDSPTNQQFPILPNEALARLERDYAFELWSKVDPDHSAVRFCTAWSTTEEDVEQLMETVRGL